MPAAKQLSSAAKVMSVHSRARAERPYALCLLLLPLFLIACASKPYHARHVDAASFLTRAQAQQQDGLRVTAAVPDAAESLQLTGLDLYAQGIQPIWLKVENNSPSPARLALRSIDKDYFSPIEVAYMNRKKFSAQGYQDMERWFYDNGLQRRIPSGESRSGLVFTHLRPGTKGFNLDIFRSQYASSFTFFIDLPGFVADYTRVDFNALYAPDEIRELDEQGLQFVLEQELPCCATDESGELEAGPFNMVLVGTTLAVRRSLLRGEWLETSLEESMSLKSRLHRFLGRPPDAIFYLDRKDGNERMELNLWMAPWRVEGEPVWLGQVFYRYRDRPVLVALREKSETVRESSIVSKLVGEEISADIDGAQRFMVQNIWYNHSLLKIGLVDGVGARSQDDPGMTFDNFVYFTKGKRAVVFLSEAPVALDEARIIYSGHRKLVGDFGND